MSISLGRVIDENMAHTKTVYHITIIYNYYYVMTQGDQEVTLMFYIYK